MLLLTELTGLYAISTVLLIRKQLPLKYRCAHLTGVRFPALVLDSSSQKSISRQVSGLRPMQCIK